MRRHKCRICLGQVSFPIKVFITYEIAKILAITLFLHGHINIIVILTGLYHLEVSRIYDFVHNNQSEKQMAMISPPNSHKYYPTSQNGLNKIEKYHHYLSQSVRASIKISLT